MHFLLQSTPHTPAQPFYLNPSETGRGLRSNKPKRPCFCQLLHKHFRDMQGLCTSPAKPLSQVRFSHAKPNPKPSRPRLSAGKYALKCPGLDSRKPLYHFTASSLQHFSVMKCAMLHTRIPVYLYTCIQCCRRGETLYASSSTTAAAWESCTSR